MARSSVVHSGMVSVSQRLRLPVGKGCRTCMGIEALQAWVVHSVSGRLDGELESWVV